ncbi:MAG: M15 family metallopeptidase, partial [Xanthobacteraceae bacterium]
RPTRAVRAMAQWAFDGRDTGSTKRYYPKLQKQNLFALGYISNRSEHSAGTTVDLTVVEIGHPPVAAFDRNARYGSCIGPAAQRAPDDSLDMGTGYDCFDVMSHTRSPAITPEQRRWRTLLLNSMAKRGFRNYHREWWHFSYGRSSAQYDFPIRPRGN